MVDSDTERGKTILIHAKKSGLTTHKQSRFGITFGKNGTKKDCSEGGKTVDGKKGEKKVVSGRKSETRSLAISAQKREKKDESAMGI